MTALFNMAGFSTPLFYWVKHVEYYDRGMTGQGLEPCTAYGLCF